MQKGYHFYEGHFRVFYLVRFPGNYIKVILESENTIVRKWHGLGIREKRLFQRYLDPFDTPNNDCEEQ